MAMWGEEWNDLEMTFRLLEVRQEQQNESITVLTEKEK